LAPYLATTQTQLDTEIQQLQSENEQLAKFVEGQKDDVDALVSGLEAVMADLESANDVMGRVVENGELQRELKDIDGEIARRRESRL